MSEQLLRKPGTDDDLGQVPRLEALLQERSAELRAARRELARKEVVARDAIERLAESGGSSADAATLSRAELERERAVSRALEAEAARLDAELRLAEMRARSAAQAETTVSEAEQAAARRAALLGTARGLKARCAELEESAASAHARSILLEHDLQAERERSAALEREAVEARERFGLDVMHATGAGREAEAEAERRANELQARLDELTARAEKRDVSLRQQPSGAARVQREQGEALAGERDGLRARVREAEAALDAVQARAAATARASSAALDRAGALEAEAAALRVRDTELGERLSLAEGSLEQQREQARELSDQLNEREQELSRRESVRAVDSQQLADLRETVAQLGAERDELRERLAAATSSGEVRQRAAQARIDELEQTLRETREALQQLGVAGSLDTEPGALSSDAGTTQPGLPVDVAAMEALVESKVSDRDERIRQLGQDAAVVAAELEASRSEVARLGDKLTDQREKLRHVRLQLASLLSERESDPRLRELLDEVEGALD